MEIGLFTMAELIKQQNMTVDRIFAAEKFLKQLPQRELRIEHDFSFGVYARVMYAPKDTLFVGKLHKYPQINLLRQGDLSVLVNGKIQRLKAPFAFGAPAGVKRIGYVHSDVIWVTIHGTHLKDLDEIENCFIAQDEQEYLNFIGFKNAISYKS